MDNIISNAMETFKKMTDRKNVIEINGRVYKKKGFDAVLEPNIPMLQTHSLQGIVDVVHESLNDIESNKWFVHVASPHSVVLMSEIYGPFLQRHIFLKASAYVTGFVFGHNYDPESFIISLNSQFVKNKDRDTLLGLSSSITKGTSGTVVDTGVAQSVEVKQGISMRGKVKVTNPFVLKPFRTFSEINQPESEFVFRIHDGGGGSVSCSIYEADGSAWKIKAVMDIKAFIKKQLPDITVIV